MVGMHSACGTREEDWRDPATRLPWDPPKLEAAATQCLGCEALQKEQARHKDVQGVRVFLRKWRPPREEGFGG